MTERILDISHGHYDGFRFVFGGKGLDLSEGGSVLIEGQAGVGKTVFALQMACRYLEGFCTEQTNEYVVYVSFEQDANQLQSLINSFGRYSTNVDLCMCSAEGPQHPFLPRQLHIMSRPPSGKLSEFIDTMSGRFAKSPGCALLLLDSIGYFESPAEGPSRDQIDRLCQRAREGGYAIIMVREKEPKAAADVSEYITDNVFELQLKPINASLSYGPQVRTIEIKKSRVQKSHRGPHEFEINEQTGILIFPSPDSVFPRISDKPEGRDLLDIFEGEGQDLLSRQLVRSETGYANGMSTGDKSIFPSGLRAGECLLLYGDPGSLKTDFGFNFLRMALRNEDEGCLFVTFKIDKRALDGIARSYLGGREYSDWDGRNSFIDARQTFWTPARVLSEIRTKVLSWRKGMPGRTRPLRRAVVFGLGMIDKLPAFQGQELTFLQVLISYFDSEGISAIFIDWPQKAVLHSQLHFDSIVNYFSTTIQREPNGQELLVQVTRHQFRVANNDTLRITESHNNGLRALKIEMARHEASGSATPSQLPSGPY